MRPVRRARARASLAAPSPRLARLAGSAAAALVCLAPAAAAADVADFVGRPIASVRLQLEQREIRDDDLLRLVETRVGEPLGMAAVRESIVHLFSLGRFQDVQVNATRTEAGVALVYDLVPLHGVRRIAFAGDLDLPASALRQAVVARYGPSPPVGRAPDAARAIEALYRERGYLTPAVVPRVEVRHDREDTTLVFEVEPGPRARVDGLEIRGTPLLSRAQLLERLDLAPGRPYDRTRIEERLARYAETLRRRGYYEAVVEHTALPRPDGTAVDLTVDVQPGPHVTVAFEGDPLPPERRRELVPIEREGSVDEDLLEDSTLRIVDYLRGQGYWKAAAEYRRTQLNGDLSIVFSVSRGLQYRLAELLISGNAAVSLADLAPLAPIRTGDLFIESRLDAAVAAVREYYRRLGFAAVDVKSDVVETAAAPGAGAGAVAARIAISEGPRTLIGSVTFSGHVAVPREVLRSRVALEPGAPFYRPQVSLDRERVLLEYLNRGYQDATVEADVRFTPDATRADVEFAIREGAQVLVGHILIVGNTRTSRATIARELRLAAGEPLGLEALTESQQRLRALGLFRSVRITELTHGDISGRDLLVTVEEAPATSLGYGGGLEAGKRLRRVGGPDGVAEERLEFAPRGFFEIGRRNLWGKNRSVDLFTRISVRPRDDTTVDGEDGAGLGFSEYRVLGTFREPRPFGWNADAVVTGFLEQAIRSSFNFTRRGIHGEVARRLAPGLRLNGRFAFDRTKLFDERFNPEDQPLIDRLFPQVRLASVSAGLLRDTRGDPLDPANGALVGVEAEIAGRRIGSQVGFVKTFIQGFVYRIVPGSRRTVLALGARVGLARGFSREVPATDTLGRPVVGPEGEPVVDVLREIPASERFFAGGDTTVRGFALDRLGAAPTIDKDGFPTGGNALVIFNTELRFPVWRDIGAVAFLDAGNVFARVSDLDVGEVRGGAGVGLRYRSPIGPIRVDLGFKLDRREFATGERERPTALHISIGHAF